MTEKADPFRPASVPSIVEGVTFPGLPEPRASAVLAILFQLERSQWWPLDRLREQQFAQLHQLLRHAVRNVPFYRRPPYEAVAMEPSLCEASWCQLPVLGRDAVQTGEGQLLAVELPPDHGSTDEIFTSGSTGRPVRVVRSQIAGLFWSAFTLRDHLWHGRDFTGKLAGIRESRPGKAQYPDGERAETWGHASGMAFATGPYVGLNVRTPVEHQMEWLERENPDYLVTHPSIAWRLARHHLETGRSRRGLRQVITIAEALSPDLRSVCDAAWGVPVVDIYSTREAGYIALQCPVSGHYHLQSEGNLTEILNHDGQPCAPGEIGRVVVTPLHNFAMPLLRYDLGDHAEAGPPCVCGRGLPVVTRILGRRQNMLLLPDGREIWPLLSSPDIGRLLAAAPIRRYQIAQTGTARLELRVATERPLTAIEESALRKWLEAKFGRAFSYSILRVEELPPNAGGKFQDVVREIM